MFTQEPSEDPGSFLRQAKLEIKSVERSLKNCLEGLICADLDALTSEKLEQFHDRKHKIKEILRLLSPEFQKRLKAEVTRRGRSLSPEEVVSLLYELNEIG